MELSVWSETDDLVGTGMLQLSNLYVKLKFRKSGCVHTFYVFSIEFLFILNHKQKLHVSQFAQVQAHASSAQPSSNWSLAFHLNLAIDFPRKECVTPGV